MDAGELLEELTLLEERLRSTHQEQLRRLDRQSVASQQVLTGEMTALQETLDEAQRRHASRESRPEDLAQLATMQQALKYREAALARNLEEMQYYKLELQARPPLPCIPHAALACAGDHSLRAVAGCSTRRVCQDE